jgi:hypothetical protein
MKVAAQKLPIRLPESRRPEIDEAKLEKLRALLHQSPRRGRGSPVLLGPIHPDRRDLCSQLSLTRTQG